MLSAGKAIKVSIYLSEGSTHHGVPTYSSILDFLFYRGVSGATVLKGIAGFGADHHMHSSSVVEISDHLPLKIEFIESREKVNEILGKLEELAGSGMIEVQETTLAKPAQVSKPKKATPPAHLKMEGKGKMMRASISGRRTVGRTSHFTGRLSKPCEPTILPASLSTAAFSVMAHIGEFTRTKPFTSPTIARSCSRPLIRRRSCGLFCHL
jgi:PII-like signaling protein